MAQYGIFIGVALLVGVTVCAAALGWKAASGVRAFRAEHHRSILRREAP